MMKIMRRALFTVRQSEEKPIFMEKENKYEYFK